MREKTTELLNQKAVREILASGENVTTVSADAVAWIGAVAREAAKQLASSGRRSPSGRLMAPRMDPGLMVRHLSKAPEEVAGVKLEPEAKPPAEGSAEWSDYNDWQTAVKRGETKLPFEEWKKEKEK